MDSVHKCRFLAPGRLPLRTARNDNFLVAIMSAILFICPAAAQSATDYDKAMAEFRAKNYSSAASMFAAVQLGHPGTTDALLMQGKCLVNLQRFADAEKVLRSYIA